MDAKFTEFSTSIIPAGVPHFHTPESFKKYAALFWDIYHLDHSFTNPDGFVPLPVQPSGVVGQGASL